MQRRTCGILPARLFHEQPVDADTRPVLNPGAAVCLSSVSYTHLDVYKRQTHMRSGLESLEWPSSAGRGHDWGTETNSPRDALRQACSNAFSNILALSSHEPADAVAWAFADKFLHRKDPFSAVGESRHVVDVHQNTITT